ncbi:MAG: PAS domain-containing protein, partial [Phototrophicaceae bacterium]
MHEPNITKTMELRCRHKDGHYISLELHATNLLDDPDVAAIIINSRNITDKKQFEIEHGIVSQKDDDIQRFLRTTLDAFPANTIVLNAEGIIINANAAWKHFANSNNGSDSYYLGENYLTICETSIGAMSQEASLSKEGICKVIDGQIDSFYLEYPCHSGDEKHWFGMRVTPFDEPAPRHVVVSHINITERILAEEEL